MFTGIIEEIGRAVSVEPGTAGARLRIQCRRVIADLQEGHSISVSGVCLTATAIGTDGFSADVSPETLSRSNLGALRPGARVNLERALSLAERLGGHIVQGHIDGTAELVSLELLGDDNWWLTARVPPELSRYLVEKGSVALDGISLTVAAIEGDELSATIVPHTYHNTTLADRRPGDRLNLECDILAKHVEKLLRREEARERFTMDRLRDLGY